MLLSTSRPTTAWADWPNALIRAAGCSQGTQQDPVPERARGPVVDWQRDRSHPQPAIREREPAGVAADCCSIAADELVIATVSYARELGRECRRAR